MREIIDPAPVTAVLWDIDGTLLHAGGVAAQAFLDAVGEVTGTRPDGRGLDFGGRIDPEIAAGLLGSVDADRQLVPEVLDRLHQLVGARSDELRAQVRPLPGVVDVLGRLEAAGVRQTVVTGNIASIGRLKLDAAALIPPIDVDVAGFGDSGGDRADVGRSALRRLVSVGWQMSLDQCWIVGDTPRDLLCARAIGVRCALVATGRFDLETLTGLGADIVLPGLEDPLELWSLWGV